MAERKGTLMTLINQNFMDRLNIEQGLKKKEFVELKKIDTKSRLDKQDQEKLQQKERKNKYMVFNYLWRHFPEAMAARATINLNPNSLQLVIQDSEFKRILKAAKRYYGSWAVGSSVMLAGNLAAVALNIQFSFPLFIISFLMLPFSAFIFASALNYCFQPAYAASIEKRKKLQELYQNTKKQNE